MLKKLFTPKTIVAIILIAIALISIFGISKIAASPDFHKQSIATLDEKKVTVMEITAATAVSSVAVSAIPGDSTSAIANQIASLSSYLLIVVGAVILEKILLTLTGYLTFTFLVPLSCLIGVIHTFKPNRLLKSVAIKLAAFGLAIFLVVPISIQVSNLVEDTFNIQKTASVTEKASEEITKENSKNEDKEDNGFKNWISNIGETIKGGVNKAVDKAESVLSNLIDSIAVLLITSCLIPILVLMAFVWIIKIIFGFDIRLPAQKAAALASAKTINLSDNSDTD